MNYKLTPKQKLFADEYLIDLNATRAYKAAYKSVKKDETARTNGSRMLTNANVSKYIKERMNERSRRTEITQDNVLKELATIAFAKVTDFVTIENGVVIVKDTKDIPKDLLPAIASIKEGKNGIEVSFYNKDKSLELLGRHLGMFNDKIEVSGTINNPMEGLTTDELKKLIDDD
ncbi:terminase small subunit [Thomasclavelia ramosa]|uniref:terminase small subunit n=1 Tax=Thomasclavelia ramosa TaxID=1547 RepID=UPI000E54102B|nr:terminase small subunit [Thomasclavelia ramosa]RHF40792.1 terminase small subunit [Thomasclavelia ramosa]